MSQSTDGVQGNGSSGDPVLSSDGRYVAFESGANNLVQGDTNSRHDIFVYDNQAGSITRVSTDSTGNEGNSHSYDPAIAADGRHIAFHSLSTNLVAETTRGFGDVYVHDTLVTQNHKGMRQQQPWIDLSLNQSH